MYILLASSQGQGIPVITLEEPDDCSRFHVLTRDISEEQAQQFLQTENVGRLGDKNTAWIDITAIQKLAQGRIEPDWPGRFQAMLNYAERKGWLSQDRKSVSGHLENLKEE